MLGTWNDKDPKSIKNDKPRIHSARNVADAMLNLSSATNGNYHKNLIKI